MMASIRKALLAKAILLVLGAAPPLALAGDVAPAVQPSTETDTQANTQATGLMWNRTGLPAVFPLQVKTSAGQDYFLTLRDVGTGMDALAAFITGGDFFKVLVPPGTYTLRFHIGDVWQGEDDLFGPGADTQILELAEPLTFEIRSLDVKAGHLVNIEDLAQSEATGAQIKNQLICQSARPAGTPRAAWSFLEADRADPNGRFAPLEPPNQPLRYQDRDVFGTALDPRDPAARRPAQRYVIWSEYCG
jgi:hypothetical protein